MERQLLDVARNALSSGNPSLAFELLMQHVEMNQGPQAAQALLARAQSEMSQASVLDSLAQVSISGSSSSATSSVSRTPQPQHQNSSSLNKYTEFHLFEQQSASSSSSSLVPPDDNLNDPTDASVPLVFSNGQSDVLLAAFQTEMCVSEYMCHSPFAFRICPQCNALIGRDRFDAHRYKWCPALPSESDEDE